MRISTSVVAVLATFLVTATAGAQTSAEVAARRLLLERAEAARNASQHTEALELASRAGQIQMTPSVRLFIAEEQEQLGRLADAFGTADLCLRDLDANPATRNREVVQQRCQALHVGLRARVGQVVVEVPTPTPPELRVTIAGDPLNPALYGAPMIVSPGEVPVTATAAGSLSWRATVRVAPGATESVRVELARATAAAPVSVSVTPVEPASRSTPIVTSPPVVEPEATPGRTQRTLGWVAAGGAVAFLAGGVVASVVQDGAASYLVNPDGRCALGAGASYTGECANQSDTLDTAQALSIVGYVTGGALAATALVLWLTAPSESRRNTSALVGCGTGPGTAGLSCAFRF
jgi:hypothetical protein